MSADDKPLWPHGGPFIAAGAAAVALAAGVDRLLYDLTGRSDDLAPLFLFAAVKRTLSTTGGVLLALGIASEIFRRRS